MKIVTKELMTSLIERTRININKIEKLRDLSETELNYRESNDRWNILECIEHLNLYGDFYIPAIKKSIDSNTNTPSNIFKSGILGNYFVKSMAPKNQLNKMKTFADKNPINKSLNISVIDRFTQQQKEYLELIDKSKSVDLNKVKTNVSISKIIRLKLGDTFRFIMAHNDRHLAQIDNIVQQLRK